MDERKRKIAGSCRSDHLMLANVIIDYEMAADKSRFCWENFLSEATLRLLISMKGQLAEHLHRRNFLHTSEILDRRSNVNSNNEALVRAVICAGLYPNVAKIR